MSFEIPKTRSEKILQNILGAKNEIEPIQSRIEAILFAILNDTEIGDPYTAPARCEIEKLLVAIKDGGEYDETPLTRSGRILLCKLRGEDYTGTTQSRLEKLFLRWLYELMEITDVPPFTFKSKGNNLIDYDIYGAEDGVGNNEDATVSGNPISVSDAIEAPADSLQVTFVPTQDGTPSIDSEPTTEPYLSKVIPRGNKEYYSLVGGTVAWNQLVHNGASDVNESGVMNIPWADGNNNYVMPMNLCHIETVEDTENNSIQVADFESHYVLPFDCVFDEAEAIIAGDTDLAAGDYYFKIANDSWGNNNGKYILFTLDTDLVAGQQIRKKSGAYNAAIEDCTLGIFTSGSDRTGTALAFTVQTTQPESGTNLGQTDGTGWCNFWHCVVLGYNRWKYSAVRQFLNSDATAGNWWTQQHKWDVMPAYATTKNGFLYGITAGVKEHLKETKVYTARNTVFNSGDTPLGGMDETLDKVFLIALEQSWIEPQASGEGTYWEYYKNLLGTSTPVARSQTYPLLIKYDLAAKTTARYRWMRSCYRGHAYYEWVVNSSGYVTGTSATYGNGVAPCLRIATSDLEYFKGTLNHKYMIKNGTSHFISIASNSYVNMIKGGNSDMSTDLTQMFGSTIADYAYSLEQSEAGSGIAWLKSYGFFTKDYYPYNPGELISVNTSGHKIGSTTYPIDPTDLRGLFKLSNGKLYCEGDVKTSDGQIARKYSAPIDLGNNAWTYIETGGIGYMYSALPSAYKVSNSETSMISDVYPVLPFNDRASSGTFFTFDGNNKILQARGTGYKDASAFRTAMSGHYLVFELATPTAESATPYTSPIDVEAGGTEEFVDNRTVPIPVGNETYYASEYAVHGKADVTVSHSATSSDTPTTYTVSLAPVGDNIIPYDLDYIKTLQRQGGEWDGDTYTYLGISYEFQSDGSVILNGTATGGSGVWYWVVPADPMVPLHIPEGYILSGVSGGSLYTYSLDVDSLRCYDPEVLSERNTVAIGIDVLRGTTVNNLRIKPAITPPVYGGTVDIVTGVLTVTWGYIASYNGETLTGEWMSSKDVYADGTTPSTGAEVVYELATPLTYELTQQQVQMLLNNNYLTTSDGTITLTYKGPGINVPFSVSCGGESNSYRVDLSDKLYKVGAYADSISYDDQTVTREIIVERLDGTEEWVLNDGVFSTTLSTVARTPAVLCNELTTEQCYISEDLTTLNITNVHQTSVEEFTSWLSANDVYVQYVRENTLVTSHAIPEVSTFNGTNTFSVDTEVTPSEVTIIYPNRVTTRALPKTKKIGKSKLTKSK